MQIWSSEPNQVWIDESSVKQIYLKAGVLRKSYFPKKEIKALIIRFQKVQNGVWLLSVILAECPMFVHLFISLLNEASDQPKDSLLLINRPSEEFISCLIFPLLMVFKQSEESLLSFLACINTIFFIFSANKFLQEF